MGGNLHPPRIGWRRLADLNFAKDPAAASTVLHAPCDLTIVHMNLCTQAPFRWADLPRISNWPTDMKRTIRNWLLAFGVYCGVGEFYLWDLLPAVYLSYPELFEEKRVQVNSVAKDLETGRLVIGNGGQGSSINLPGKLLDRPRLMEILYEAWGKTLARMANN